MATASPRSRLLLVDAAVNLALGVLLLLAPLGSLRLVGIPPPSTFLFTTVLGGVLVGIGGALLASARGLDGLGLVGAITINVAGAVALIVWLVGSDTVLLPRAANTLWAIAVVVLVIAGVEIVSTPWREG